MGSLVSHQSIKNKFQITCRPLSAIHTNFNFPPEGSGGGFQPPNAKHMQIYLNEVFHIHLHTRDFTHLLPTKNVSERPKK